MKYITSAIALILLSGIISFISCRKERTCESCPVKNKHPIAIAGPDLVITLPTDSILLDGSLSSDPDGIISAYEWSKISGPASFTISNQTSPLTVVKNLANGIYLFELSVQDNRGLAAKDTVRVFVQDPTQPNRPPVANAGPDQTIVLPVNTANVNGMASYDPDNNINSYQWTKISGPASFLISNAVVVQPQVTSLLQGIYLFELKVTDAGGLFSTDTMQITVNITSPPTVVCTPFNRDIINAQLMPFGTLSESKTMVTIASAGSKILFAGGQTSPGIASSLVDIYDINTQLWSTAQLSVARFHITSISIGNKIYFAGGLGTNYMFSSRIDIYDVASNSWSIAELSEPRSEVSAATIGSKIMFAGGYKAAPAPPQTSDRVDIYDLVTNSWSTATLSIARAGLSATSAGNKIYFAGGFEYWNGVFNNIDIYDNATNTWSISALSEQKAHHGAFAIGNYIYWAGGEVVNNSNDFMTTCDIERRDILNGSSTTLHLYQPSFAHSTDQPAIATFLKNGLVVFYTGSTHFDIYDPLSDHWSIGIMNEGFDHAGVISVNNTIYIAGGGHPYFSPVSNKIWKLEF